MLMMLTAKNTLPAESASGADLATLLISVFFLIFMKYQRKIKEKGLMLAWAVVSATALMTPPGGCSLKRVGKLTDVLPPPPLPRHPSLRLSSKPDTSALKPVLGLPWRQSPCGLGHVLSFSARGEMRIRSRRHIKVRGDFFQAACAVPWTRPPLPSARSNKRATPRSRSAACSHSTFPLC